MDAVTAAAIEVQDLLPAYDEIDHQVWVKTPQGGFYAYRTGLGIFSVARSWSESWNKQNPADVPEGSTFHAVKATQSFTLA